MNKSRTLGFIALGVNCVIYGVSYISRNVILKHLHSTVIIFFQMVIMLTLFTAINLIKGKSLKIDRKDLPMIILSGLTGTLLFQLFTVLGVQYAGPLVTSLFTSLAAAISLLVEYVLFHRQKTALGILAALISVAGVYIIAGTGQGQSSESGLLGYGVALLAVISWVAYSFISNGVSGKYEQTVVLNYQAIVGCVTMIPFIFIYPPASISVIFRGEVLLNLVMLGAFSSTLSYFLSLYAFKQVGVTLSNIAINCASIVTIIVSIILYNDWPGANEIIGGLILVVAVVMLDRDERNLSKN